MVLSIGPKQAQEQIRTALAMGADRGIHVTTDKRLDQELQPLSVAKLFKAETEQESPDIVLLGKQSIDGDCAQTGPLLAAMLGWPQATFACKIDVSDDKSSLEVERETDVGTEVIKIPTPSVVTTDLRLNEPRYATLPNIMKAKKKKIDSVDAESYGIDLEPRYSVVEVNEPPVRQAGILVENVDDLIDKLKNEAGVLG